MRSPRIVPAVVAALLAVSCADRAPTTAPDAYRPLFDHTPNHPSVRFSEIHYDNTGTDANEAIEVSGPAGTDLTGWSIVLYNGSGGAVYNTASLSGTIPATANCNARGVVVVNYPVNGIQNGSPDGFALVNGSGQLVEFLSYEGTFTGVGGAAAGILSTDIGVSEPGTGPSTESLQRTATGTWSASAPATFGACNDDDTPPPAVVDSVAVTPLSATVTQGGTANFAAAAFDAADAPIPGVVFAWATSDANIATVDASGVATAVAPGDVTITATAPNGVFGTASLHVDPATPTTPNVWISEFHYDNSGTDTGEQVEIEGPAGTDVTGWRIIPYNGNGGVTYTPTFTFNGTIPTTCGARGVLVGPIAGLQNGYPDGLALVDAANQVVQFLSYEGTMTATNGPAAGMTSVDVGVSEAGSEPAGQSLQRDSAGTWSGPKANSFGACNPTTPPPPAITFAFSGRFPSEVPLPVGFQDQLFVTVSNAGGPITTTITWSSDTPSIASIDQDGVFTALAAGTAVLRATTATGETATWTLPTQVATGGPASYVGNTEFGVPADADASDDILVVRPQYTASFSAARGTPNWVSYDLEATHFGTEDRCDCFTYDPTLPAALPRYTTAAYTGSGTYHGYGIDRGHLSRSFDRTSGSLDNATTFYFTNIIPQAADLNQGPWAAMESYLGDLARLQNMEVYIITGVAGSKGTLKDQGLITIPAQTWKVAVIMPRDRGLADVQTYQDVQVIAAIMPNDPGIRNVDWNTYRTTVDAVEALSGYDLLALLSDQIEIAVESNTAPPTAATNGPFVADEGSPITMTGAGSTDPDGDVLTFVWDFGDGQTAYGAAPTHTYAQDGLYTVRLVVTDIRGLVDTAVTTAAVANVAPVIGAFPGATLLPGETYVASGSFADPGADTWTATVDYGDGSGVSPLALSGMSFTLGHVYAASGAFTVTVSVDDGGATSSGTATVTVLTHGQGVARAIAITTQLYQGGLLSRGEANSLTAKLEAAHRQLARGGTTPAINQLEATLRELDGIVRSGRLSPADAAPLRSMIVRVLRSLDLTT